jgi:hypothetical protein
MLRSQLPAKSNPAATSTFPPAASSRALARASLAPRSCRTLIDSAEKDLAAGAAEVGALLDAPAEEAAPAPVTVGARAGVVAGG